MTYPGQIQALYNSTRYKSNYIDLELNIRKMYAKDQVLKIIFFFHTNRPNKKIFPDFSRMENDKKTFPCKTTLKRRVMKAQPASDPFRQGLLRQLQRLAKKAPKSAES